MKERGVQEIDSALCLRARAPSQRYCENSVKTARAWAKANFALLTHLVRSYAKGFHSALYRRMPGNPRRASGLDGSKHSNAKQTQRKCSSSSKPLPAPHHRRRASSHHHQAQSTPDRYVPQRRQQPQAASLRRLFSHPVIFSRESSAPVACGF